MTETPDRPKTKPSEALKAALKAVEQMGWAAATRKSTLSDIPTGAYVH